MSDLSLKRMGALDGRLSVLGHSASHQRLHVYLNESSRRSRYVRSACHQTCFPRGCWNFSTPRASRHDPSCDASDSSCVNSMNTYLDGIVTGSWKMPPKGCADLSTLSFRSHSRSTSLLNEQRSDSVFLVFHRSIHVHVISSASPFSLFSTSINILIRPPRSFFHLPIPEPLSLPNLRPLLNSL